MHHKLPFFQGVQIESEFLSIARDDVKSLCAELSLLWSQYKELFTLDDRASFLFAREHHIARVSDVILASHSSHAVLLYDCYTL